LVEGLVRNEKVRGSTPRRPTILSRSFSQKQPITTIIPSKVTAKETIFSLGRKERKGTGKFIVALPWILLCAASGNLSIAGDATGLNYVTNRAEAFALAQKEGCAVLLYTGRAVFCPNGDPRGYFFKEILPNHPQLESRPKKYVVCEQFTFATNVFSAEFREEQRRVEAVYSKYNLKAFWPAMIPVDAKGNRLSGPYLRYFAGKPEFSDTIDHLYETFQEYLAAEPPVTVAEAQANLRQAAMGRSGTRPVIGLFRSSRHPQGGQKKLILENGMVSTQYEVGEALDYNFLRGTRQRGEFSAGGYEETLVAITGLLTNQQTYTGSILVQMNDAWFRSTMEPVGNRPDHYRNVGGVTVDAGEYYFLVYVRDDMVARMLLRGIAAKFKKEKGAEAQVPTDLRALIEEDVKRESSAKPEPIPAEVFSSYSGVFGWELGTRITSKGHGLASNYFTFQVSYTKDSDPSILPFDRVVVLGTQEGLIYEIQAHLTPQVTNYAATKESIIHTFVERFPELESSGPDSAVREFGDSTNKVRLEEGRPQLILRFQNMPLRIEMERNLLRPPGANKRPPASSQSGTVTNQLQPGWNQNPPRTNRIR